MSFSLNQFIKNEPESVLNGHAQVFLAKSKSFSILLIIASFIDPSVGICGLIAMLTTDFTASIFGSLQKSIREGYFNYNSYLVGCGIGAAYELSIAVIVIVVFSAVLTYLISMWLSGRLGAYGLPMLSLGFVIGGWIITLATRQFSALEISERGIFLQNEIARYGGINAVKVYEEVQSTFKFPKTLEVFFKSLGAVIFQSNILAGMLIAIGLLIYSRISFLLALLGFYSGWLFYSLIGADLVYMEFGYIGFNFILTAIALGGYFLVPSIYSFLLVLLLTPVTGVVISASSSILQPYQLGIYSLPFNLVSIVVLYALKLRSVNTYFTTIVTNYGTPERNMYQYKNTFKRFPQTNLINLSLPFYGEWKVSQGYNGFYTHKDAWSNALDFVIADENNNHGKNPIEKTEDFYCYKKPILAPADGTIAEVTDHIPDNNPGDTNLEHNWGNTVIIKHADGIYTKLSHLLQYSILYPKNTFVKKGDVIAYCGSSGRSPEPHLHFQVQHTPYIGAPTVAYQFMNYVSRKKDKYALKTRQIPDEGDLLSNVVPNLLLSKAFQVTLGSSIMLEHSGNSYVWESKVNIYNQTYLYCLASDSKAYFINNGSEFYFTLFEGDKSSLLYFFFLSAYKLSLGVYDGIEIQDEFPIDLFKLGILKPLIDTASPFVDLAKSKFSLTYQLKSGNEEIELLSVIELNGFLTLNQHFESVINVKNGKLNTWNFNNTTSSENYEITFKA